VNFPTQAEIGLEWATFPASRVAALIVIRRQSRVEAGRLIASNSSNQSSAEILACSIPNNSLTELKKAVSSCSADIIESAHAEL